jgi:hypothetical protein
VAALVAHGRDAEWIREHGMPNLSDGDFDGSKVQVLGCPTSMRVISEVCLISRGTEQG